MNRRVAVAAVLIVAALGVGVARSVSHGRDDPAPVSPPPVVSAVPTAAPAPATAASEPGRSPSVAGQTPNEPVNEAAGADDPATGAGRDAGPTDPSAHRAEGRWRPVATGFAMAFTTVRQVDTTDRWRSRLAPYVTAAVGKQLATVDVANVPTGRFDGLDVLESSDEQITVQATYGTGWALAISLVSDGNDHWKVSGYDRLEQ